MSNTHRLSWVLGLAVGMILGGRPSPSMAADASAAFFDMTMGAFHEELGEAEAQGKKGILLFFEIAECPFCFRMRNTVLNQPEVLQFFRKNFLIFAVDAEGDDEIEDFEGNAMRAKDFARVHRVRATPVSVFFDLEGKEVTRHVGATGTPQDFLWLGEYVSNEVYREMPFLRFKRQKQKEQVKP